MGTNQKLTAKQKAERIKAAQEREAREKARREAAARTKKIFTVVVCVILVLALGIPTIALSVLSMYQSLATDNAPVPERSFPRKNFSVKEVRAKGAGAFVLP